VGDLDFEVGFDENPGTNSMVNKDHAKQNASYPSTPENFLAFEISCRVDVFPMKLLIRSSRESLNRGAPSPSQTAFYLE
jgi:hypothetical protein